MDSRAFLLHAYRMKQNLDHNPSHGWQAVYLVPAIIIFAMLYASFPLLKLFTSLPSLWNSSNKSSKSCEYPSHQTSTPGAFPDDRGDDSIMDTFEYVRVEKQPLAPSSTTSNTENSIELKDPAKNLIIHLQQQLEAANVQVKKAQVYVLSHLDAKIREELTAAKLQATQTELDETKRALNAQNYISQQNTVNDYIEMKKKLEESEDRVAKLLEVEVELTEEAECLKLKLDRVSDKLKATQSANVEASMKAADLEKQFKSHQPRTPTPVQQENFALGSAMKQYKTQYRAEYDGEIRWRDEQLHKQDEQLRKQNEELMSLHSACEMQIQNDRNTFEQEYAKLVAENAQLRAELYVLTGARPQTEKHISDLQATVDGKDRIIQQQSTQLTQLLKENSRHDATIFELTQEKAAAAHKIKKESKIINSERIAIQNRMEMVRCHMQSEIDDMRNSNLKQQARLQQLERERDNNTTLLEQATEKIEQLTTQLTDRMDADPQSKEKYEEEIKRLKHDVQKVGSELSKIGALNNASGADLQRTVTKLQHEVQQERLERARAQSRFDDNLKRLVEANKKVDQLQKAVGSSLSRQTQQAHNSRPGNTTFKALQNKLSAQEATLKEQCDQIQILQSTTTSQATTVTNLTDQVSALTSKNSNLQYLLTQHKSENANHKTTITNLEAELQQRSNHVAGVQTAFETTRCMHEAKIAELQTQLDRVSGGESTQLLIGYTTLNVTSTTNSKKRTLDTHYDDEIGGKNTENSSDNTTPLPAVDGSRSETTHLSPSAPAAPLLPASKRAATATTTDKSSLDWELFEGPSPDLEVMIAQDKENARREAKAKAKVEVSDEMNE